MNAITIISLKKGTLVSSSLVVPCSWQFIQRLSISENTLSALMSSKRPLASGSPSAGEVVEVLVDMLLQVIETQQRRSAGKRKERRKSQERAATRMTRTRRSPAQKDRRDHPAPLSMVESMYSAKALSMMKKMGYQEGKGLGRDLQGPAEVLSM